MDALEDLCQEASEAAAKLGSAIASGGYIRIVSHNDVDGVCSGTIAIQAVRRQGGSAHLSFSNHVYESDLASLLSSGPDLILFCDMGSDLLSGLRKSGRSYLVLDHHHTGETDDRLVNPSTMGIDGTSEISASGVTYLVARELNSDNIDLSPIALCGAFGDMQGLTGANDKIASEAESEGLVERKEELRLIGRVDRPMEYSICYSTLPFIKGLSGNQMATAKFLRDIGVEVDTKTSISELDDEMERVLIRELAEKMVREDASTSEAERLFGRSLRLLDGPSPTIEDAVDYVESCSALGEYSTALAYLVGSPGSGDEVERLRLRYKEKIFEGVGTFESAKRMENLDYIDLDGWDEFVGKLCGIYANAGFSGRLRPVFGLSKREDSVKVSGRTNPQLVRKGLDLGSALSEAARAVGGQGGGHSVAAGAKIPVGGERDFLDSLDRVVGRQLGGGIDE